jgi:hypothetical protein
MSNAFRTDKKTVPTGRPFSVSICDINTLYKSLLGVFFDIADFSTAKENDPKTDK